MSELIFYNSFDIFCNSKNKEKRSLIPGGNQFASFFQIFSENITCIDRNGIMQIPLKTKILDHLKIPEYTKFDTSFSDICDERAKFLLHKSEHIKHRKIVVMYSGGIDSTLILCSFLKHATPKQLDNILVLLSEKSIDENPNFYYNHIIKKFKCESSWKFQYFLGNDDYLFVTGENADQLFGSQVNDEFTRDKPYTDLFRPIHEMEGQILDFLGSKLNDGHKQYAEPFFKLFEKMVSKSPIELNSVYRFFWWINFTTKWQSVYLRIIPYSKNTKTLKLEENYTTFYHTKEFQLWSLNNTNKFSYDVDQCGKKIAKQYILDVNGDVSYLNKPKMGSLSGLARRKEYVYTIDSDMNYINEYPSEEYYNCENDFVELK
jgi:hypothetical protein